MFHQILKRLRDAALQFPASEIQRGRGENRIVRRVDLAELLHHYDRLDAEARLGYPPHIAMLADASEKVIEVAKRNPDKELRSAIEELSHALQLARPVQPKPNGEPS